MSAGDGSASLHSASQVSLLLVLRVVNQLASGNQSPVVSIRSNLVEEGRTPTDSSQVSGEKLEKEAKRRREEERREGGPKVKELGSYAPRS